MINRSTGHKKVVRQKVKVESLKKKQAWMRHVD